MGSRHGKKDDLLQESAPAYKIIPERLKEKKQGEFTIDDYMALPEEERWELIDGHLYRLPAPSTVHQVIAAELFFAIRRCIEEHAADCLLLTAPTDVQLDMDERTILEPDLFLLCDLKKLQEKRIYGAPDFAVEIISPSTRSRDMVLKKEKYRKAGVREYWIIDPKEKCVIVNLLEKEAYHSGRFDFHSVIPVGISEGKCLIDFTRIAGKLESLYEGSVPV